MSPDAVLDHPARVLIVDDERSTRQLLEVMLQGEGFELQVAKSGEEALTMVASNPPDLILLDIMMGGMDGCEVTAVIKGNRLTRHIPVIMVTAMDDREARMNGLTAGAEDFLTKPVDRAELRVRVRNLLRLKAYGDYQDRYSELLEGEVMARTADLVERSRILEQHAAALRRNEERMTFALGVARMGVWEIDVATQRLTWSETMAPLFGLSADQIPTTAAGFLALIHPDDRQEVRNAERRAMREGVDYDVEFRVLSPGGPTRWITGCARMIRDERGAPLRLLGVSTDISTRKSLEAQLRQSQKMEAVGQLAGGVAHDFNNILTAILAYSSFVNETFAPHDERRADMQEVINAGERAATLTRQLLAFSRKQVLQPTAVDLNTLVLGMQQMLSRLIGEHVEFVPILSADLGTVRADLGQLEQVLMNLVVNARDAMPSGGRLAVETANVELDQSFSRDTVVQPGPYVMLAVSDNGSGMSSETKERLFEPFFTTKPQGQGTGLGLATVYGIVKQSGGFVWVYSEPGKGATFKIYLPRIQRDEAAISVAETLRELTAGTETILLVEDETPVRNLTRRILERAGYRVFDAANADDAAMLFERHASMINLLVTDVVMPGGSGPALFERLAYSRPDLRVLYVSGYTDDTIVTQGQLEPGVEFLQKPFSASAITRRVREVLDGQHTAAGR